MTKESNKKMDIMPDKRPLTKIQAKRLSSMTGLATKELVRKNVASIVENYKWKIDPKLLFFQRICGRVVKVDPATLEEKSVPFATVHVMDTDCHLLCYAPFG
jgi:hypothetical protein